MTTDVDPRLREVCEAIVAAFPSLDTSVIAGVQAFPKHMCRWSSLIAGEMLRERGLGDWRMATGQTRDLTEWHAWLITDELHFDPTAHQFDGVAGPLLGRGPSPLAERFGTDRRDFPTGEVYRNPAMVEAKRFMEDTVGRAGA